MSLIPEDVIQQVLDRADIAEIIGNYVPLKKAGRNFKANCPFHNEKTPSFVVNPEKQIFHCFGCGAGGNVVSFVMKQEHMEFPEAIRLLAQKVNVEIPERRDKDNQSASTNLRQTIFKVNDLAVQYFQRNLLSDKGIEAKTARDYLKGRGVELESVQRFQLGFALNEWDGLIKFLKSKDVSLALMEKAGLIIAKENGQGYYDRFRNRIIFPIFDTQGHCRAFGARAMDDSSAKYINSPETLVYTKGHHLYGFHLSRQFISQADSVIVVEGYMDCIIPFEVGVKNILASLGTALTVEQVRLLQRYTKNIVMLFDADPAGQSAMMRSLDMLVEEGMDVKVATLTDGEDPDSFVRKFGVQDFNDRINKSQTLFEYKLSSLMNTNDIRSIEGKAKISSEMLSTVARFPNAVVRSGYVQRLSQIFGVAEQAMWEELKKSEKNQSSTTKKQETVISYQMEAVVSNVETNMLKLLLEEDSFISATKEQVAIDDFKDARIREVMSKIYELFDSGKKVTALELMQSFDDKKVQQLLSQLAVNEDHLPGDKLKMHKDFVAKIVNSRQKNLRQDILNEMREAELAGHTDRLEVLKQKFNQLLLKK